MLMAQHLACSALGAGIGFGISYTAEAFKPQVHKPVKLEPMPEAFEVDPQSFTLFSRLQRHKSLNDKATDTFAEALLSLDALFVLERYLQKHRLDLSVGDRYLAESHAMKTKKALTRFQAAVSDHVSERDLNYLEEDVARVQELVDHHLSSVYTLTSV